MISKPKGLGSLIPASNMTWQQQLTLKTCHLSSELFDFELNNTEHCKIDSYTVLMLYSVR
jgi:hypothetical protein